MKHVLKYILLLIIVALIALLILTFVWGFDRCLDYVLNAMGDAGQKDKVMQKISVRHFTFLQIAIGLVGIACSILRYAFNSIYPYLQQLCEHIYRACNGVFCDLKTKNALLVLLIPMGASIYFGATLPVSYDEAYTYIYFTSKPFYVSMVYYPVPNNHILHSIFTNIAHCLPGVGILFAIRIPAILASITAWAIAFSFIKRFYSEKIAMWVVGLSSVLFLSIYYSYMSRGYALMFLFFVISTYSVFSILKYGNQTKYWAFFTISSILAFYTIPTYLYPFATLHVVLLIYNIKGFRKQIASGIVTVAATVVLYTPIIIVNGLKSLVGNKYVAPRSRSEVLTNLPTFAHEALHEIFGLPWPIILLCIVATALLLLRTKGNTEKGIYAIFVLAPLVLLVAHSVIPFPRTFAYYTFIVMLFLGISLKLYIEKIPNAVLLIAILVVQIGLVYNFKSKIATFEGFNTYAKEVNDRVIEKGKTYYVAFSFRYINHRFEMHSKGCNPKDATYNEFATALDADSLAMYDYVIVDKNFDQTKQRKPFFENKQLNVYRKPSIVGK